MEKIKVGIPRGLLYYKYKNLWENFLENVNIPFEVSDYTNKSTLLDGTSIALDESCLALKIFLGHVNNLKDKCDYILIPRIASLKKNEKMCTNFMALYDLCNTLFDIKILEFNIDVENGIKEIDAFLELGRQLNIGKIKTLNAYYKALKYDKDIKSNLEFKQSLILRDSNKKILVVGHPYNLYDELIGQPIIEFLRKEKITVLLSDYYDSSKKDYEAMDISKTNYWTYNKELLGSIVHYRDKVDGIILITSFPCGPDSLTNEIIVRKTSIPIITLVIDELNDSAGIITRLESFIDVIKLKRRDKIE